MTDMQCSRKIAATCPIGVFEVSYMNPSSRACISHTDRLTDAVTVQIGRSLHALAVMWHVISLFEVIKHDLEKKKIETLYD